MATGDWWEFPDYNPDNPAPGQENVPGPGGGPVGGPPPGGSPGGGGCGAGTVPESIGADGNWRTPAPGECIDQAEFNRRVDLNIKNNPNGGEPKPGGMAAGGPTPAGRPNYGPAPMFEAPVFQWGEKWVAPTLEEAMNEPGYKMAAQEGERALQQSAAARGVLGSGGTLKDISAWGNRFAEQNYNNVFGRNLTSYNTRFGTAKDIFDRFYTGKKDEYAPKLFEWQTNAHGADLGWQQAWDNYWRNNLTAQDIWNS